MNEQEIRNFEEVGNRDSYSAGEARRNIFLKGDMHEIYHSIRYGCGPFSKYSERIFDKLKKDPENIELREKLLKLDHYIGMKINDITYRGHVLDERAVFTRRKDLERAECRSYKGFFSSGKEVVFRMDDPVFIKLGELTGEKAVSDEESPRHWSANYNSSERPYVHNWARRMQESILARRMKEDEYNKILDLSLEALARKAVEIGEEIAARASRKPWECENPPLFYSAGDD